MKADEPEHPEDAEGLKTNLRDDVRSFLLKRLRWNRLSEAQRGKLRRLELDKKLRRPTYMAVESMVDDVPPDARAEGCHVGAEGVMTHTDEDCVHLAFKCGNTQHAYHYSTLGIDTIVALAKACEATWPGSISRHITMRGETRVLESQSFDSEDDDDDDEDDGPEFGAEDESE